jgi:flavin-dependent dehydrogenase
MTSNLPATLSPEAAAATLWDAVVVGAGPAGATAARELAGLGRRVLLVDRARFPRRKVCGCCLNGSAAATLRAVGLGGLLSDSGAVPVRDLRLSVNGISAELPLPATVALSREAFDAALVRAAVAAGAGFLPEVAASVGSVDGGSRSVTLNTLCGLRVVKARLVVGADGLSGRSAESQVEPGSRLGIGAVLPADAGAGYPAGRLFMAVGRGGYVGLVRLEDGRLDVAAAADPGFVRDAGGPGPAASQILESSGFPIPSGWAGADWRGTPLLTRRAGVPAGERLLVVGDAAGYVEPFTGEGMAWALAAGRAVAPIADRGIREWDQRLITEWSAVHRRAVAGRQTVCRAAAFVLRRPGAAGLITALLACWPGLAGPVLRRMGRRD